MKNYLLLILVTCFAATAGADVGKLTGRDAAAFGAFMTKQNVVTDTHYGAHPMDPATFFKGVFDAKNCATPTNAFKSASLQIKVGHMYCFQSNRSVADIGCTLENEKKTQKITLAGQDAYAVTELLQKAGIKSTKTATGTAFAAGVADCVYEGVQNCLGTTEKGGRCRFL